MTATSPRTFQLIPHPKTPCAAVQSLTVKVHAPLFPTCHTPQPSLSGWCLRYRLEADISQILVPPVAPQPGPADNLWQHTCFEAFLGPADHPAYREFNFSPSGHWAAYAFSGERERDEAAENASGWAASISLNLQPDVLVLEAWLPPMIGSRAPDALKMGLTAVIETQDQGLSYWALQHPAERPDFHQKSFWTACLDQGHSVPNGTIGLNSSNT